MPADVGQQASFIMWLLLDAKLLVCCSKLVKEALVVL